MNYRTASVKKGRYEDALEKMHNGTPEEQEKAGQTIRNMQQNAAEQGMDLNAMIAQLDNAKKISKDKRDYKVKNGQRVLAKAPKQNKGTGHSNDKQIINYF